MNYSKKRFPIEIVMITLSIILFMYIYCYSKGSYLLWVFFIIERLISLTYDQEIDKYLDEIEVEKEKGSTMFLVVIFALFSLGIFIVTPFKYPGLFLILVLGEIADFIIKKAKHFILKK